ncbi:hypothetical protein C8R44DRAFT_883359 [Mycena epipterygia]|nr:hypothetical protein C8R44DRAFT_883359 [Mycena epipterygia]
MHSVPGAYAVLFAFYVHGLCRREIKNHRYLTVATVLLFILSTVHCALQLASITLNNRSLGQEIYADLLSGTDYTEDLLYASVNRAASAVYVTSNLIADGVFAFRCYAVWNFRRKIMILPLILIMAVAGLGYANVVIQFEAYDPSLSHEIGPGIGVIPYEDNSTTIFFGQSIGVELHQQSSLSELDWDGVSRTLKALWLKLILRSIFTTLLR